MRMVLTSPEKIPIIGLEDCSGAQGTPAADPKACAEIPIEPKTRGNCGEFCVATA
jgi:hypothetical protein